MPVAAYAYPAVAGFLVTSRTPQLLGRYSLGLACFLVWNILLGFLTLVVWRVGSARGRNAVLVLVLGSTFLVPMNGELRAMVGMAAVLPLIRLFAAVALLLGAFEQYRACKTRRAVLALPLGAAFVLVSLTDFGLLAWSRAAPSEEASEGRFREVYDLGRVAFDDILITGDSFVWGAGVANDESFGNQLAILERKEGRPTRVYNLGVVGGDVRDATASLSLVPEGLKARRVVLAVYLNDMPGVWTAREQVRAALTSLGEGCPTLRFVGDRLGKISTPDVDTYHREVIRSFDRAEPSYPARFQVLESHVRQFREVAAARADARPVFLILPLMVDFGDYPLAEAHRDLARLAEGFGYEVLDLLPVFRERLGDGRRFRAAPNDNHFDAATHALVARTLKEFLEKKDQSP